MTARFRIRRVRLEAALDNRQRPWAMLDRERPHRITYYATMPRAIAAVSATLREEANLPPALDLETEEILKAIRDARVARDEHPAYRHVNAPCIVEPYGIEE